MKNVYSPKPKTKDNDEKCTDYIVISSELQGGVAHAYAFSEFIVKEKERKKA